jgi:uncharacterized membrane protein YiaA
MPNTHFLSPLELCATFSAISCVLLMNSTSMKVRSLLDRLCSLQAFLTVLLLAFSLWTFTHAQTQLQVLMVFVAALLGTLALAIFGGMRSTLLDGKRSGKK